VISFSAAPQFLTESSFSLSPIFSDELARLNKALAHLSKMKRGPPPHIKNAAIGTCCRGDHKSYEKG